MCGIVGYAGQREAASLVLAGLRRLEYRGYDSAGIAVLCEGKLDMRRAVGKLSNLEQCLVERPLSGCTAIGHTRWATHGPPSERNAHPHLSMDGHYAVVHNGIVENYLELRAELMSQGIAFRSETDSEVIAHLVALYAASGELDFAGAVRHACQRLRGGQAIAVLSERDPQQIVAVRIGNAGGVVIGIGTGEMFVASDAPAILEHTRDVMFLEGGQVAILRPEGFELTGLDGGSEGNRIYQLPWDGASAARGAYRDYMEKEIFEQGDSVAQTLRGRIDAQSGEVTLSDLSLTPARARQLCRMVTLGCGSSGYAGLIGKFIIEALARLPVEVDYSSEFRYRHPVVDDSCVALAITQSGETVDTLAAMNEMRARGGQLWSIVNVVGSQAMRLADGFVTMQVGPELSVASTKAFTASVVDQALIGLYLAQQRGSLRAEDCRHYVADLARLPTLIADVLGRAAQVERLAAQVAGSESALFLGRGISYPVALEGALKLKEVSYIHAEGYPAGEMKHGPIALIDERTPVVVVAIRDGCYEKMVSQIEQAKARGGCVIAIATDGDDFIASKADQVFYVPPLPELLSPVVTVIPLALAYYTARLRGCDVDRPRHLAKSVVVE